MDLWRDVRFAARLLVKGRWFTLSAAAALSLGIGANSTVFTLVNAVLLRGLPFENPEQIVGLFTENREAQRLQSSYPDYEDWRDQAGSLSHVAAYLDSSVNVADDTEAPERAIGAYVSANFFRMLGEQPLIGRDFTDGDDSEEAPPVALLAHGLWESRYGADPGILGNTIRVNSVIATVIGVMSPGMRFPNNADVWIPRSNLPPESLVSDRSSRRFNVVGRLAPGSSLTRAREELVVIGRRLAEAFPDSNRDFVPNLLPYHELEAEGEIRLIFLSLMGAVAFVLLIACANVANLLLARSADRAREMSVRVSVGATRFRIVRQLVVESLLLAFMAGAAGFLLSIFGIRWFDSVTQDVGKPYWMEFSLDGVVFAFVAGVCFVTAIVFGLAPALHVSKVDVNETLKEGTRGGSSGVRSRRWAGMLIVGELVLTLVLLSGAGFMMRSFLSLYNMELPIETGQLVTMRLYMPLTQYADPDSRAGFYEDLGDRLATMPTIQSHAIATNAPLSGGPSRRLDLDGRIAEEGESRPEVTVISVSDGYFGALGLELSMGRAFNRSDGFPGSEAAIVNQRFVEMYLAEGALGRQVRAPPPTADLPSERWLTVVGVSPTVRQSSLESPQPDPVMYVPIRADPPRTVTVMVRSPASAALVIPEVQDAMRTVDPDIPVYRVMTMDQLLAESRWLFRTFGLMFSVFAGIALMLSALGTYSVTAYSVAQRTREIGIRVALGAAPGQVSWLSLRRSVTHLAIGLPIGLLGALAVGRLLTSLLVQTSPSDPMTLAGIAFMLSGVSLAACIVPARRATRLDPMAALRVE